MKTENHFWRPFLALAIAIALIACWRFWLFREEVIERSEYQPFMVLGWRWGWPYQIATDHNGDGRFDSLMRVNTHSRVFTAHFGIQEDWLDADFDGKFEVRFSFYPDFRAEIDDDGDYIFDRTLEGDAASEYRNEVFRSVARAPAAEKARKVKASQ